MVNSRSLATRNMPPNHGVGYQQAVQRLITQTALQPLDPQHIMFVGSSILRLWKTLASDLYPLPVVNLAFGGSRTWEVLYYTDRLIIPCQPQTIVYYCGSNDINGGANAEEIKHRFQMFVEYLHSQLPDTKIFFLSINRAPQKRSQWHIVDGVNDAVKGFAQVTANLEFIDLNSVLCDENQQPRLELFTGDGLHLKPLAYQEFTKIIKPILF